jgi:hypothetical protein
VSEPAVRCTVHDTLVLSIIILEFCKCLHTGTNLSFLLTTFVLPQSFVSVAGQPYFFQPLSIFTMAQMFSVAIRY